MQHSRSTLQANDLLDIVDFIKNEEKYTVRINELKAREAALADKLKIANTIEKAVALGERNRLIEEKLAKDRAVLEQEFKTRKSELETEESKKQNALATKIATANSRVGTLDQELRDVAKIREELKNEKLLLQESWIQLNKREMELHARDESITRKVDSIKNIMSS